VAAIGSSFRYFFHQVDVPSLCAAIRDWTLAKSQVAQPISIIWCVTARL
jgi:hypothetical protein